MYKAWCGNFTLQVFALFILLWRSVSCGFLVGLDLGNAYYKIATVSNRGAFEILVNAQSERKTPTAVCFGDKTRVFGHEALQHSIKNPAETATLLPSLMGLNITDTHVVSPLSPFLALNWSTDTVKLALIHKLISSSSTQITMCPEELLAHQLQYIKETIQAQLPRKLNTLDVAVTIPSHFGMRHRQSVAHAFSLARLNLVRMIQETPAAALHHTMDLPPSYRGKKLFINVGAWHTEVCVIEYGAVTEKLVQTGRVKKTYPDVTVVWCESEPSVGGHILTRALAEHLVHTAEKSLGFQDLKDSPSILQRFLHQAERAKVILSTNKVTEVYLESVKNGKSFRTTVTRETFQDIIRPVVEKAVNVVERAFTKSNHTRHNISGVEIVGGGWRVPFFQAKLAEAVKPHALGQHLNAEEAMAFGATLAVANATNVVRLRPIQFLSPGPFKYVAKAFDSSRQSLVAEKILVPSTHTLMKKSLLVVPTCADLLVELWENSTAHGGVLVEVYHISGIALQCKTTYEKLGTSKVSLSFHYHHLGWWSLSRAVAQWEEHYMENVPVKRVETNVSTIVNLTSSDANATTTGTSTTQPTLVNVTDPQNHNVSTAPEMTAVKRTKYHTFKCNISTTSTLPKKATDKVLQSAQESLKEVTRIDHLEKQLAQLQNTMEAYAYKSRATLSEDSILDFVTEPDKQNILQQIEQNLDWLYSAEAKATKSTEIYEEKFNQLRFMMEPVFFRRSEKEKRQELEDDINMLNRTIDSTIPKNITEEIPAVQTLLLTWKTFKEWYGEKMELQRKEPLYRPPVFNTSEVIQRIEEIKNVVSKSKQEIQTWTLLRASKVDAKNASINNETVTATVKQSSNDTEQWNTTADMSTAAPTSHDTTQTPAPQTTSQIKDEL